MSVSGGTISGGTGRELHDHAADFFREVDLARERGATSYSSGGRRVVFAGPPTPPPASPSVAHELDYAQTEQVVHQWLERQGMDMNALQALIRQQEELMSA